MGLDDFDIVGFDPRGVDRSGGISCVSDEVQDKYLYVDPTPDDAAEAQLYDEAKTAIPDACRQKYGDDLVHYSTANTARDMDEIRKALGDEQITFLGISYGTYLGAVYATMFPDQVRAMVLDSAYEPTGDTIEQQYITQLVGFEGAFDNWAAWCAGDEACPFKAADAAAVGARWDAALRPARPRPARGGWAHRQQRHDDVGHRRFPVQRSVVARSRRDARRRQSSATVPASSASPIRSSSAVPTERSPPSSSRTR